jgi:chorismate dehydratase
MSILRISASSYSNTAPLVWSFLYGQNHGKVELILDNAPARSAELLSQDRVDAALVPVIASQFIEGARLIPDVCVGARRRVRSVCLVTSGMDLEKVKSVSLDSSSRTSVVLTKIIFREFLGFDPEWRDAEPDLDSMLIASDAALLIGDPALSIAECGTRNAELSEPEKAGIGSSDLRSKFRDLRSFDLAELWHQHTGLGFVFAMWMTKRDGIEIDFAGARDEGLAHIEQIAANYAGELHMSAEELREYLTDSISFSMDDTMQRGMDLYFELAEKSGLIPRFSPLKFL